MFNYKGCNIYIYIYIYIYIHIYIYIYTYIRSHLIFSLVDNFPSMFMILMTHDLNLFNCYCSLGSLYIVPIGITCVHSVCSYILRQRSIQFYLTGWLY